MPSYCSTDKDGLVGIQKAWGVNRDVQFPNNYPFLSHEAIRERIILLFINKELILGKLPLTVLKSLLEKAAFTSLGGIHRNLLHPRNVELCSERNKPGLSPKQDSVSNFIIFLIIVPEKKIHCSQISLTMNMQDCNIFVRFCQFAKVFCRNVDSHICLFAFQFLLLPLDFHGVLLAATLDNYFSLYQNYQSGTK